MKNISPKYLSKISLLVSVLLILIIVVSCTPQITDEELEAELAQLTPEEREQLLEDLENEKGALAGQAIAKKYGSSNTQVQNALKKLMVAPVLCLDSDGDDPFTKGTVRATSKKGHINSEDSFNPLDIVNQEEGFLTVVDGCYITISSNDETASFYSGKPEIYEIDDQRFAYCSSDDQINLGIVNKLWETKGYPSVAMESFSGGLGCGVIEFICHGKIISGSSSGHECPYGCSKGACCPESGCLTVQQSQGTPQIIQN